MTENWVGRIESLRSTVISTMLTQYEQLPPFDTRRVIGMMEAGRSARQVARQLDRSDCVVRGVLGPVDPTDIIYTKTRGRMPTTEQLSKRPAHEYKMHEYSSCFIGMLSWHR
ncbi:UNVERIFIED_CONTAM: hypothetical protein NCL1_51846 [Trichonephila clavipes]